MPRGFGLTLAMLSAIGVALSLYLTYVHYRIHLEPTWQSACDMTVRIRCDVVILSPFGSVGGMPLSLLGTWFYAVLMLPAVFALRQGHRPILRSPAMFILAGAAVATAASVVLGLISRMSLGSFCPICVALYAINLTLFVVAWRGFKSTGESVPTAMKFERSHWGQHRSRGMLIGCAALAVLLTMRAAYARGTVGGSTVCGAVAAAIHQRRTEPIELKVFSDFQCPHCVALDHDLRELATNPGLRLVQRSFPLDATCNPAVARTRYAGACTQARAALCADAQGGGAMFRAGLFDEGAQSRDELEELAAAERLDVPAFKRCLDSDETANQLGQSIRDALAMGVQATPTVFVNGQKLVGRIDANGIRCLALAESGSQSFARR